MLAGLLIFRLLYYLVPFVVALGDPGRARNPIYLRGVRPEPARPAVRASAPLRSEIEAEKIDAD